jgi:hypothetical protein
MTVEPKKKKGWQAGVSGNPAGRKAGTGKVEKLRAAISGQIPELLNVLMERALMGDVPAARLLLERTIPPLKAAEDKQVLSLPNDTLAGQGRAVLASVASGELAPTQGAALIAAIGTLARVIEVDELSARIAALENKS